MEFFLQKTIRKGELEEKKWFLKNAKPINIDDEVYDEIFLKNSLTCYAFTNIVLEKSYHIYKDDKEKVYLVLNPDPFVRQLSLSINKAYTNEKIEVLNGILQDVANENIFVIAEYNKQYGWFDYDKVYEQKQTFKQQHESEIKEVEN